MCIRDSFIIVSWMGIVNISDMKRETEGEKNFTPVTKSSIFQKTEQTTTVNDE